MNQVMTAAGRAESQQARQGSRLAAVHSYLYVLPALLLVAALLLYPVIYTVAISFTEWDLVTTPQLVGLEQYRSVASDPAFVQSFANTLLWTAGTLILPVLGGLLLAVWLERLPGQRVWKVAIYLPHVLAATVVAVVWQYVYANEGVLNQALRDVGLGGFVQPWLALSPTNTYAMIVTSAWRGLGSSMVLFLVGLQMIPSNVVEASALDGASGWQQVRDIKLPLLKPITAVVVLLSIANSFTTFDLVWVMTQGGPFRSSETLAVTMYRQAFVTWDLGYASALAVILSSIVLAFSIFYLRMLFRREA
jgi:multiple sugar transport system permease protein